MNLIPSLTAAQLAERKRIHEAARKIADAAYDAFVAAGGRAYSQKANDAAEAAYQKELNR